MPKGKKFDAAQKHFQKKQQIYEKRIKELEKQLENSHRDTRLFRSSAEYYQRKCEELTAIIKGIQEVKNLSDQDIKAIAERDEMIKLAFKWLSEYGGMFSTYNT